MIEWGTIQKNEKVAKDIYQMVLSVQKIARSAKPGQFVNIRLGEKLDPLLRRPISLHEINPEDGTISLLYLVVGKGTEILSKMKQGEELNVLGPLGNGFATVFEGQYAVLAGGGIGIAPLFPLAETLCRQGKKVILAVGAKSEAYLTDTAPYERLGVEVCTATDDGSYGRKGFVTDLILDLKRENKCDYIYACGPSPMLRSVEKAALEHGIRGQVSTESNMGCGLGVCLCCPNKVKTGGYKRTCVDGPVFEIGELDYE